MREWVKRVAPQRVVRALRYGNRFRWITKARLAHASSLRFGDDPVRWLRYVLLDPEVESFSYELDNPEELAAFVSDLLGVSIEEVSSYLNELERDPELNGRMRRRLWWRLDTKTRPPAGHRALWYALARALKPPLIVETGTYQGLGALVLLRALDRNSSDGRPGKLISVDTDPHAGHVVPKRMRARWTLLEGTSRDTLERAIGDKRVGMLIQDTPHTYENASFEFGVALKHADENLVLVDAGAGVSPALREACAGRGTISHFQDKPRNHFYETRGSDVGLIRASS